MKIQILSDLHLEFDGFDAPATDADVVVLAGDIHVKFGGLDWAIEQFPDKPVVYVLGNHEYYGGALPKHTLAMQDRAAGSSVIVLENDAVDIGGIRFLGCALWTDFELYGDPRLAGYECTQKMTDFRKIRMQPRYNRMRSIDARGIHLRSRRWLAEEIGKSGLPTVVVTHHAPSAESLGPRSGDDLLDAAYASNLDQYLEQWKVPLWIHGHIHLSADYTIGKTRVVCNPRGYPGERNREFDPMLCVEVPV